MEKNKEKKERETLNFGKAYINSAQVAVDGVVQVLFKAVRVEPKQVAFGGQEELRWQGGKMNRIFENQISRNAWKGTHKEKIAESTRGVLYLLRHIKLCVLA